MSLHLIYKYHSTFLYIATQDRQRFFRMSDHFNDDDDSDDTECSDTDQSAGLSFHVSRERVTKLRDNLVNMLPHYFNRHTGKHVDLFTLITSIIVNGNFFRLWVLVSIQEPGRSTCRQCWIYMDG